VAVAKRGGSARPEKKGRPSHFFAEEPPGAPARKGGAETES